MSLLATSEISETKSDSAKDKGLWKLRGWAIVFVILLLRLVLLVVAIAVDVVLALLDSELQVEELFEMS